MLTSRKVGASERPLQGASRPTTGQKLRSASSRRGRPANSSSTGRRRSVKDTDRKLADSAAKKKLAAAKRKAAKADKARNRARAEKKSAEKKLKKISQKVKATERRSKRPRRGRPLGASSGGRSRGAARSSLAGFSSRKSSRKGFERRPSSRLRLTVLTATALLTVVVIGATVYLNSAAFAVTSLKVEGQSNAGVEEITAASGIAIGQNLMDIEPEEASANVAAVPWVDEVSVERKWNGSVTVSVSERVAVAALQSPSGYVLVDSRGRQLATVSQPPESQIQVTGVQVTGSIGKDVSAAGLQATNFIEAMSPQVRPLANSIDLGDGRLTAQLNAAKIAQDVAAAGPLIAVNFGTDEKLDQKMVALETLLARVDLACVVRIDLSSPSKPTVRRTSAATNLEKLSTGPVDC